jgi:hypothetical protein
LKTSSNWPETVFLLAAHLRQNAGSYQKVSVTFPYRFLNLNISVVTPNSPDFAGLFGLPAIWTPVPRVLVSHPASGEQGSKLSLASFFNHTIGFQRMHQGCKPPTPADVAENSLSRRSSHRKERTRAAR